MKHVHIGIKFCIGAVFLCIVNSATAEEWSHKYDGTRESFTNFAKEFNKNWPIPKIIDYFDPSGGGNHVIRYAHWTSGAKSKGTVVHFNGRTEFIEKNIYTYQDLLSRGYDVWAFDWYGQGFSERQKGVEKQKHIIASFDKYINDATYFIDNIVKINSVSGKKILLAHSMGGQIAIKYLESNIGEKVFDYAVLSSPLIRLNMDYSFIRYFNKKKVDWGYGSSCVFFQSDYWESFFSGGSCSAIKNSGSVVPSDENHARKYSNDFDKLATVDCIIESSINAFGENKPDLRVACPTSQWLMAAFESTDKVVTDHQNLKTPTLMLRSPSDKVVDTDGQNDFCRLAKIKCVDIKDDDKNKPGHELLIENEFFRKQFFEEFDSFVGDVQ